MINIVLFGPPGAGKGTQSKKIFEKYNLTHISTGDMLREEIANNSPLGKQAKSIIEKGGLVPDDVIVQIIEEKIKRSPDTNGFLFDGFPRTVVQAYILEGLLLRMNTKLSSMISLEVPRVELIRRMTERASRENRADDRNMDVINFRLQEYEDKTKPVADFFRARDLFVSIDGTGTVDQIFNDIDSEIQKSIGTTWSNIILFGPPGAGKGTQAKKLAEKYNVVYISTGSLIRDEIEKNTALGKIAKPYMDAGDIVPDEVAIRLIEDKLNRHPNSNGFIFKGFPLTMSQAYILESMLWSLDASVSKVLEITSPTLLSFKRLTSRSKTENARGYDMNPETIIHRLEVFEQRTSLLREYYNRRNMLQTIDGSGDADEVFKQLCEATEKTFKFLR